MSVFCVVQVVLIETFDGEKHDRNDDRQTYGMRKAGS